jgi:tryptophan synthase beta chain
MHMLRVSREQSGADLTAEDLNHTGAHKINNTIGQAMGARYRQPRNIAETGAGQQRVATANVCARYRGLYGQRGCRRQSLIVYPMAPVGRHGRTR